MKEDHSNEFDGGNYNERGGGGTDNDGSIVKRDPIGLATGAIYHGEWKGQFREGYGI